MKKDSSLETNLKLTKSIGLPKEVLPPLRTKANADLAGLSPPLVLLKDSTSSKLENSNLSLNNIWLTVLTMVTTDVTEV